MYLQIHADGELSLQDIDDMKSFSIVEQTPALADAKASSKLAAIAEVAEDNHYWINAEAIIQLSKKADDPDWIKSFWLMLQAVEPYGYADLTNKRVKAHVETR